MCLMPPGRQFAGHQCNATLRLWNTHIQLRVLVARGHPYWLLTLVTEKRPYFSGWSNVDFFFLISFHFSLISFYSVLSCDRKIKQKEKEVYAHFILSYSLYEHRTRVFYLIPRVDTFLVSWNIAPINPCLQTPWNIYWIIQYRFQNIIFFYEYWHNFTQLCGRFEKNGRARSDIVYISPPARCNFTLGWPLSKSNGYVTK